MIGHRKVVVVLPAYNAERTLERTVQGIARDIVDEVILVDDGSQDRTIELAEQLGVPYHRHTTNLGYGANQKTCYQAALDRGADIVVMLHPDYQYPPELVPALAGVVASGVFHVVLGSRILGGGAIRRQMPIYKYCFNRLWTWGQNRALGQRLSEYHTGFRAFSREVLLKLPILENSDDFLFDNQLLVQARHFGYAVGEVSAPSRFLPESSSITPWRGTVYGLGVARVSLQYLLERWGVRRFAIFNPQGRCLRDDREVKS